MDGDIVLPVLSAGHANLTSSNFRDTLREAGTVLVAATSRSCHHCIRLEPEYQSAASALKDMGVSQRFTPVGTRGRNRAN